jgi:hypothetical protein
LNIQGAGADKTTIIGNSRIFTLQSDNSPPVGMTIEGLALSYDSGSQGYILAPSQPGEPPIRSSRPTMEGLTLTDVGFAGQHRGGVSGTYNDISGSRDLLFDGISVSLEGQSGYNPSTGEGGGFFFFMEGGRNLQVRNSMFSEAGYSSSLIALFTPDVIVDSSQFVGAGLIKQDDGADPEDNPRGERFYNAGGAFTNNSLSGGAFFDYFYVLCNQGVVWQDYLARGMPHPCVDDFGGWQRLRAAQRRLWGTDPFRSRCRKHSGPDRHSWQCLHEWHRRQECPPGTLRARFWP